MINDHVVPLPIAKELWKVLPEGFKSDFLWIGQIAYPYMGTPPKDTFRVWQAPQDCDKFTSYPALLLSEMLALLPEQLDFPVYSETKTYDRTMRANNFGYFNSGMRWVIRETLRNQSLLTATAKVIIELTKRGLIPCK